MAADWADTHVRKCARLGAVSSFVVQGGGEALGAWLKQRCSAAAPPMRYRCSDAPKIPLQQRP
eukprot:350758-Chlamydomonas_euryale.AAC.2